MSIMSVYIYYLVWQQISIIRHEGRWYFDSLSAFCSLALSIECGIRCGIRLGNIYNLTYLNLTSYIIANMFTLKTGYWVFGFRLKGHNPFYLTLSVTCPLKSKDELINITSKILLLIEFYFMPKQSPNNFIA